MTMRVVLDDIGYSRPVRARCGNRGLPLRIARLRITRKDRNKVALRMIVLIGVDEIFLAPGDPGPITKRPVLPLLWVNTIPAGNSCREEQEGEIMMYAIELKEIEPRIVASIRTTSPWEKFGKSLGEVLEEVGKYLRKIGVEPVGPPFARYFSLDNNSVEFEAGLPIATLIEDNERVAVGTLPGGKVAMTWHTGPYEGLTDAHAAIRQWIGEQGLKGEGAFWELYWSDPRKGADPATWKSEVIWPVK